MNSIAEAFTPGRFVAPAFQTLVPVAAQVLWSALRTPLDELDVLYARQETLSPDLLTQGDLPSVAGHLFDHSEVLQRTLDYLGGRDLGSTEFVRSASLQFGERAHIIFHEAASTDGRSFHFVTYVSRGPAGTEQAQEAEDNYRNLKLLSSQFETRLKPYAREKYGAVMPIAFGYTVYKGQNFPIFTMPFIPYGELSTDSFCVLRTEIPYFSYAVDYTDDMVRIDRRQGEEAVGTLYRALRGEPDAVLRETDQVKRYEKQRDDLLRGNALIYLISGGFFPKDFQVNAGDWMVLIEEDGLRLALTCVRGGWEALTEEKFCQKIRGQTEISPSSGRILRPFLGLSAQDFQRIMTEARALIK